MNADFFFRMGSSHKICQDYAFAQSGELPFAIVSDGCSSAKRTDFGSRLLVASAENLIYQPSLRDQAPFLYGVLQNAHTFCRTLSLDEEALCATLLVAKVVENTFQTLCVGDGCVAALKHDGTILVHEYEFESGAPYYLRYELEDEIKREYFDRFGMKGKHRVYTIVRKESGHEIVDFVAKELEFSNQEICFAEEFPLETFKGVAIFSDGIQSFQKMAQTSTSKTTEGVRSDVILNTLFDFRRFSGEFLQQQCLFTFKQFTNKGISHYDDFSMAMLVNE